MAILGNRATTWHGVLALHSILMLNVAPRIGGVQPPRTRVGGLGRAWAGLGGLGGRGGFRARAYPAVVRNGGSHELPPV